MPRTRVDHFARDGDAFFARLLGVVHAAHALHVVFRHGHAQLVHHEFGVAKAGERPDAADHRNLDMLDALEKCFQQIQIEHRLRDHILGAGLHFPFETADLLIHVQRAGIGAHADQQGGLRAHGVAADIQAVIQIVDDVDQADGVHVEDGGGVGISAHARRIAGDADQVADARGVRAQQLGLDAQNVAVAAAEVNHRFDAGLALDELAGDLRAHAGAGARAVRNVDAIDAGAAHSFAPAISLRRIHAARRQNLDEGDELPGGQFGAQLATFRATGTVCSAWALARALPRSRASFFCAGCSERASARISLMCSGVVPQQPPTMRTPAHSKRRAYCAMYSGEHRYMLRPSTRTRQPGVGHGADGLGGERHHPLDGFERGLGTRPSNSARSRPPAIRPVGG